MEQNREHRADEEAGRGRELLSRGRGRGRGGSSDINGRATQSTPHAVGCRKGLCGLCGRQCGGGCRCLTTMKAKYCPGQCRPTLPRPGQMGQQTGFFFFLLFLLSIFYAPLHLIFSCSLFDFPAAFFARSFTLSLSLSIFRSHSFAFGCACACAWAPRLPAMAC